MTYHVVMTMNRRIWDDYGHRAVGAFLAYWDPEITLHLYCEDFDPEIASERRLVIQSMPAWHGAWKQQHAGNPDAHGRAGPRRPYDYHRDCVKFSHKVAALTDCAAQLGMVDDGVLIMLDADVITHAPVSPQWLDMLFPANHYMAWLFRQGHYPECGFVMFAMDHAIHLDFMADLREQYEAGGVFRLRETHDSFVIQDLVNRHVARRRFPQPHDLCAVGRREDNRSHPFVRSRLGERMDHLKGKRKAAGRTDPVEAKRSGGYWAR